jgi:catechol 2,3-dioxygenase-like lactoylglutathione lyase family enzyme
MTSKSQAAGANKGVHHIGLATHDMEATLDFYEKVLGFEARVCEMPRSGADGTIRHAFLDMGRDQMIAFMEPNGVPGLPEDFDCGINRGLGIGGGMIHFAFFCDDETELEARQAELRALGVDVTDVVDHR